MSDDRNEHQEWLNAVETALAKQMKWTVYEAREHIDFQMSVTRAELAAMYYEKEMLPETAADEIASVIHASA